ncbi:hypothetical protein [Chromobacterium violaceum]|uniref:hypothetical protein n=1 Tax=Chromobacterium violaceum TaxID=536 RepID=UPI00143E0349|nr:hypothetical protein [Chromobacterium violaceum]QIY79173.1 hypothetical protein FOB43_08225 [Chromobacterium violaceum]
MPKALSQQEMCAFLKKAQIKNLCKTIAWWVRLENLRIFSKNLLTEGGGAGIVRLLS